MAENEIPNSAPSPAPSAGGPPPIAERIQIITSTEAYNRADHPEHAATVNMARLLFQQQDREERSAPESKQDPDTFLETDSPEAKEMLANLPPTSGLARQVGVDVPDLPQGIEYTDSAIGDFLGWCLDEGLNKAQVQSVLDDYSQWLTIGGRAFTGERPGDAEEWTERLKGYGLSDKQARRLVKWHQANTK